MGQRGDAQKISASFFKHDVDRGLTEGALKPIDLISAFRPICSWDLKRLGKAAGKKDTLEKGTWYLPIGKRNLVPAKRRHLSNF
jgi:hypothetical protein